MLRVAPDHVAEPAARRGDRAAARPDGNGGGSSAPGGRRRAAGRACRGCCSRRCYLRQGQAGEGRGDDRTGAQAGARKSARPADRPARVALAKGDLAQATAYYERATAADKDNARLRTRLAQTRFASGERRAGLQGARVRLGERPGAVPGRRRAHPRAREPARVRPGARRAGRRSRRSSPTTR